MKIADILEIADKATLFKSDYIPTLSNFRDENKAVIRVIPEMEFKLRSMVDMLPEIYNGLNSGNYDDLLSKIEKWEVS